jgi:hypothetical protein
MLSNRIWLVSTLGNNANTGHASAYPFNWATDAKLTISAAVTAAAAGDTIIVDTGTYTEKVDFAGKSLNLIGMDKANTIITHTLDDKVILLASGSTVKNLTAKNNYALPNTSENTCAIYANSMSNIVIENCYIVGNSDAVYITSCQNVVIRDCFLTSNYDIFQLFSSKGVFISNCSMVLDTPQDVTQRLSGIVVGNGGQYVVEKCHILITRSDTTTQKNTAFTVTNASSNHYFSLIIKDTICRQYTGANCTVLNAMLNVAETTNGGKILLVNCIFDGLAAAGTYWDIYNPYNSKILIDNCIIDESKISGDYTSSRNRITLKA